MKIDMAMEKPGPGIICPKTDNKVPKRRDNDCISHAWGRLEKSYTAVPSAILLTCTDLEAVAML